MRILGSLVLLTGGLSAAAYAYFPVASFSEQNLAKLISIQAPTGREALHVGRAAAVKDRSFAPTSPLYAIAVAGAGTRAVSGSGAAAGAPGPTLQASQGGGSQDGSVRTAQAETGNAWRPIVTPADAAANARAADDYVAQVELARELQRELKRVGCYEGDADGDWKAGSRRAMSEFLGKVNATLPVDRPDYILLTLLQGHADRACGVSCPAGQAISSDGRCTARAIVAQAPAAASSALAATSAAVGAVTTAPQRAPRARAETSTDARVAADGAAKAALRAPAAAPQAAAAAAVAAAQPQPAREPLPGRMSVGAPLAPPGPAVAAVAPVPPEALPAGPASGWKASRQAALAEDPGWTPKRDHVRPAPPVERAARAPRRVVSYAAPRMDPPRRRKFTMNDLMRQLNGF